MSRKIKCPICKQINKPIKISNISQQDNKELYLIHCFGCQRKFLSLIYYNLSSVSSLILMTDLNQQEVNKFISLAPLTPDEALNCYRQFF